MKLQLKEYLPFYLAMVIIVMALSSCNVKKDLTKSTTDTKTEVKTDVKTESVTTSTTTEKGNVTIETAKDSLTGQSDNLFENPIYLENENLFVTVTEDKKGIATAKAVKKQKKINVPVDRVIVSKTETKSTGSKKENINANTKESQKKVERTGGFNFNYLWWLLLLLLIPIFKFRKVLFG